MPTIDLYWIQLITIGLTGLAVGSFLNVVILRWPKKMEWQWQQQAREILEIKADDNGIEPPGIVFERSHCPKCKHQLSWWENIPLFSYIVLLGKCRGCKTTISPQYPTVEVLNAGLWVLAWCLAPQNYIALLMMTVLVTIAFIDLRTMLIPDELSYILLWSGLIASVIGLPGTIELKNAVLGGFIGYTSLFLFAKSYGYIRKKEGMGHGDFKLFAGLGAWCGSSSLLPIIVVATFIGVIIGIIHMIVKKENGAPFPFGPALVIAGLIQWVMLVSGNVFLIP
jgi:leader peptidase (prepilin peptidase) / N-methyltransferase